MVGTFSKSVIRLVSNVGPTEGLCNKILVYSNRFNYFGWFYAVGGSTWGLFVLFTFPRHIVHSIYFARLLRFESPMEIYYVRYNVSHNEVCSVRLIPLECTIDNIRPW